MNCQSNNKLKLVLTKQRRIMNMRETKMNLHSSPKC